MGGARGFWKVRLAGFLLTIAFSGVDGTAGLFFRWERHERHIAGLLCGAEVCGSLGWHGILGNLNRQKNSI